MVWGEDPFQQAPAFISRMHARFRLALSVTVPVGIASLALAATRSAWPNIGQAAAAVFACMVLAGASLALSCALMVSHRHAKHDAYVSGHALGMLLLNATVVTVFALAEMCMLALVHSLLADPQTDTFLAIGALAGASVFFALTVVILSALGERTFNPPSPDIGKALMLAAGAVVLLTAHASFLTMAFVAILALAASAAIALYGRVRAS